MIRPINHISRKRKNAPKVYADLHSSVDDGHTPKSNLHASFSADSRRYRLAKLSTLEVAHRKNPSLKRHKHIQLPVEKKEIPIHLWLLYRWLIVA